MGNQGLQGVQRLIQATYNSFTGLRVALIGEAAFRQELVLCAALAPLGLWWGKTGVERALMLGSLMLLLIVELLNTAVESAIDRIGSEHHPLSGRAKDVGSAAVLLALGNVVLVWGLVIAG